VESMIKLWVGFHSPSQLNESPAANAVQISCAVRLKMSVMHLCFRLCRFFAIFEFNIWITVLCQRPIISCICQIPERMKKQTQTCRNVLDGLLDQMTVNIMEVKIAHTPKSSCLRIYEHRLPFHTTNYCVERCHLQWRQSIKTCDALHLFLKYMYVQIYLYLWIL